MQASVLLLLSFLAPSFSQISYQQHEEPYFLSTGEVYRDKVTLETAKQAAKLAKKVKQESKIEEPKETENSFPTKLNFYQLRNFTFGEPLPDYEIFGYIDSQFLNPPFENLENTPDLFQAFGAVFHNDFLQAFPMDTFAPTKIIGNYFHLSKNRSDFDLINK